MAYMRLACIPLFWLFLCSFANAGQATSVGNVVTPVPYASYRDWYQAHRALIYKAANAEILKGRGDGRYEVSTRTKLGTFTYIVEETVESSPDKTVYRIEFVESTKGYMRGFSLAMTASPHEEQTQVALALSVKVSHILAISREVKAVTDNSIQGAVSCIRTHSAPLE